MVLMLFLICSAVLSEAVNVTVVTINVINGTHPFDYRRSGPAIDLGLEYVRTKYPHINVEYIYRPNGEMCNARHVGELAAFLKYSKNISVFIGPSKSLKPTLIYYVFHKNDDCILNVIILTYLL